MSWFLLVAFRWLGFAAPAWAIYNGSMAAFKRGDYVTTMQAFRLLAKKGHTGAQFKLGVMHYKGEGMQQTYTEAVKWFGKAAEQGRVDAQFNLGVMYYNGESVTQDYISAHMWFNLAAAKGCDKAAKDRDVIAAKMMPADIAKAQRMAREWLAKHGKADWRSVEPASRPEPPRRDLGISGSWRRCWAPQRRNARPGAG